MSTKKLLQDYSAVRKALAKNGPSDDLLCEYECLGEMLEHYRLRHEYEQARIAFAIHREFSDSPPPLTENDINHLIEAMGVDRDVVTLLRKKNSRGGATP